jgi:hypothetical protein
MNMTGRVFSILILSFLPIALSCTAAISFTGDFSCKTTIKPDTIDIDTTVKFSLSADGSELISTWKADEDGFSSLKVVVEHAFPDDIDGRGEVLFDEERLKTLKLKISDFPVQRLWGEQEGEGTVPVLDIEAYFKNSDEFYLYQVSCGFDDLTIALLPASLDLVLRQEYLRAKLVLDREDDTLTLQDTWKDESLYERKVTIDHDGGRWSVKEALTLDPTAFFAPEEGTLTVNYDLSNEFSLKVVCDHTFSESGIELVKLVPTIKLDRPSFNFSWKGDFRSAGGALALGDYDLTVSAEAKIANVTLDIVFKLDEDGFRSFSIKLSLPLSGG